MKLEVIDKVHNTFAATKATTFEDHQSKIEQFVVVEFTFDGIKDLNINTSECKFAYHRKKSAPS